MTATPTGEDDLAMNEPCEDVVKGSRGPEGCPIGGEPRSDHTTGRFLAADAEHFSVVVIGGGPAGLAAGYELSQRGIEFVILGSESRLGENWRARWDSVRLFTPARFHGLPGLPFDGEKGRYSRRSNYRSISSST